MPPHLLASCRGDGDDLYVVHQATLYRVHASGEIAWQQQLPETLQALQHIDAQHLALFSEQRAIIYHKEDGKRRLQLVIDQSQRIAEQAFADRYLTLLLEDRLHRADFGLTLTRIPLLQLQQLLDKAPLLQEIASDEVFTLQRGHSRLAELVLSAVEHHLQHKSYQDNIAPVVEMLSELYRTHHLVPNTVYTFPQLAALLQQHDDQVVRLTAEDMVLMQLLRTSFF